MRQIPLSALDTDMTVQLADTEAEFGGKYLAPVEIKHIRYERKEALNPYQFQLAENAKGRIWIDAVNSEGGFLIPVGSKVTVGSESMAVLESVPYMGLHGRLHHWEVDCG